MGEGVEVLDINARLTWYQIDQSQRVLHADVGYN